MTVSFEAVAGFVGGPSPFARPLPEGPDILMPRFVDGRLRPRSMNRSLPGPPRSSSSSSPATAAGPTRPSPSGSRMTASTAAR